ncbi:putative F420-dependent oxidoreductase [Antricoccus suffuscus]|uniref:Putative F420-dependent oxidoreductase n=1 Tax=Antricoccus suffuscus TaxID=1629062 RepID=A0A2T1A315_9ACTN|nr:LLM class F420-dependent oxidoreductase [Antricoccus suffuscus]PRZ42995.1 putative F420-dependent oxidoreductase [Antricoccus suffuscus]
MSREQRLSISLGLWQDRPPQESLAVAQHADRLGYDELWVGEMATYDAFALGTAVGLQTARIPLVLGAMAVTVRDPMMLAMGVASVADLTGRATHLALGTSSTHVVEAWHGRSRGRATEALVESARAVRSLLHGEKVKFNGEVLSTNGYHLRLAPPQTSISMAAFGPRALMAAAEHADRLVINLVDVPTAKLLVDEFSEYCGEVGRVRPPVAMWVCAAPHSSGAAMLQLRTGLVGYLMAPGYAEMFARAGFGDLVDFARRRPHPRELLERIPDELIDGVSLIGSESHVRQRISDYRAAGIDEIVVVPSCTDDDPAGERSLTSIAAVGR